MDDDISSTGSTDASTQRKLSALEYIKSVEKIRYAKTIPMIALVLAMVAISTIRATRSHLSFEKCSAIDFTLLGVFALFATILTVIASIKIKLQGSVNSDAELTLDSS